MLLREINIDKTVNICDTIFGQTNLSMELSNCLI